MTIAQSFLAEFEQESVATRKFLERLPEASLGWRPHPKSMTLGQLGLHLAQAPGAVLTMAVPDECEPPNFGDGPPQPANAAEILAAFDESLATVRKTLPTIDDARMAAIWTMKVGGQPILVMPRVAILRSIFLNHTYHHRGQLSVYLRELGVSVPSAYGPTADEAPDFLAAAS